MKTLALVVLVATASQAASAGNAKPGGIIYPSDGKLWLRNGDGAGKRQELAAIPGGKSVEHLSVNRNGTVALLSTEGAWHWVPLRPGAKSFALDCKGPAQLSANGRCVVCNGAGDEPTVWVFGGRRAPRRYPLAGQAPVAMAAGKLLVARAGKLVLTTLGNKSGTVVSPHAPESHLLVSPNGKRAVGYYPGTKAEEKRDEGLHSFRLDGRATKRRLFREGRPVTWSRDSRWLVTNAHDSGCMLSAVGGQYKCWKNYRADDSTPDGKRIFLRRKRDDSDVMDLYRAPTKGARPIKPKIIVKDVDGPAVWTPRRPKAKAKAK